MDERTPQNRKPSRPRRRKRSKLQRFKETYLPLLIAATALLLIIIFIIGSITRAVQHASAREQAAINAAIAAEEALLGIIALGLNTSTVAYQCIYKG